MNLGNSTCATVIPGRVAELLFGSNAYTKGAVFMIYGTEEAKKTAEDMAKAEGLPFSKKKASAARKNLFIKRR